MRQDVPAETATEARAEARAEPIEPTTGGSGEAGPWGDLAEMPPAVGAPRFSHRAHRWAPAVATEAAPETEAAPDTPLLPGPLPAQGAFLIRSGNPPLSDFFFIIIL